MSYGFLRNSRSGLTTEWFETIEYKESVRKKCSVCGKMRTRVIKESQTVNPFNKNKDGSVKTWSDVHASVIQNLKNSVIKFKKRKLVCNSCVD